MKIAAWNLINRVGKVPFRLEAAAAAIAINADIYVFNETTLNRMEKHFKPNLKVQDGCTKQYQFKLMKKPIES